MKVVIVSIAMTFFIMTTLSGCFAAKGYPGPERPDTELAILNIEYDAMSVAVSDAYANDVSFGSSGIKLLPGKQNFSMNVTVKEPPENCYKYPVFNYKGFDECEDRNRNCNCFNYLTVYRKCYQEVRDGNCGGNFVGKAGMRYSAQLKRTRSFEATLTVLEEGSVRRAGAGSCDIYGSQRTEEFEENLGTGRSIARANGIYSCY